MSSFSLGRISKRKCAEFPNNLQNELKYKEMYYSVSKYNFMEQFFLEKFYVHNLTYLSKV